MHRSHPLSSFLFLSPVLRTSSPPCFRPRHPTNLLLPLSASGLAQCSRSGDFAHACARAGAELSCKVFAR
eukprot:1862422-Rhodomonas_salina.2